MINKKESQHLTVLKIVFGTEVTVWQHGNCMSGNCLGFMSVTDGHARKHIEGRDLSGVTWLLGARWWSGPRWSGVPSGLQFLYVSQYCAGKKTTKTSEFRCFLSVLHF